MYHFRPDPAIAGLGARDGAWNTGGRPARDAARSLGAPAERLHGSALRPRIVGLAARVALDALHQVERLRHLVAGHLLAAVGRERLEGRPAAFARLDDGRDALPPALVGEADPYGVEHVGVALQRLLHLLGVDLLPARVDADAAAAEQRDGAVRLHLREVAR